MAHSRRYLIRGGLLFAPWATRLAALVMGAAMFLFGVASTANAQGSAAASPPVRFTVFSARPIAGLAFVPRPNVPPQSTQFYPTARSPRYEYRGAMPLRFVDGVSGAVVAEASIPPGVRDALLLFTPVEPGAAGAGGLRYRISVLDDGAARHGPGGLGIINLSGLTLGGTVNGEKVVLQAGLNPTRAIGQTAKIALTTTLKNRTYQAYSGTLSLGRNERALLLLFPPFYKGSLEVQSRMLIDRAP